ncbi:putative transcription regulator mTERF family [Helianthus annuus]|nr:putative transcription regulator mTERF family [Helianthus annuus]
MLGSSLPSTLFTFDSGTQSRLSPDLESNSSNSVSFNAKRLFPAKNLAFTRWRTHSAARTPETVLTEEDMKKWEACRQVFSRFEFTKEEEDKILGKAFGLVHSPYWGEEREVAVPELENVNAIFDYLTGLGLSDDDLIKILKKFPEVVGCSLENELKTNIEILEKQWSIKGKSLKNLLLRNPKVLGYIIDCKGDCKALCTRCWVRF